MGKLRDVNTTSILKAIRLGCRTMCTDFNVGPEEQAIAHLPGRFLNALLNAEDAAGVRVLEERIQRYAEAAFASYSGPVALPLDRDGPGGPVCSFWPHNVREGLHALHALARYRDCARARDLAEACIADVSTYWSPEAGWRCEALAARGVREQAGPEWATLFIPGIARAIGPLVKYYRATGYGPALELAVVL
jgi:hypothetical protein